jgi:formiminoglutamase
MEISSFLDPVSLEKPDFVIESDELFARNISVHTEANPFPSIEDVDIAIVGIPEDRNSYNNGSSLAPDAIRQSLYQLYAHQSKLKIADLGNIKTGTTFNDTYAAVKWVVSHLIENNITIVVLGGTQDLTIPIYEAFENYHHQINLSVIDPRIDADSNNLDIHKSNSFLNKLVYGNKQSLHNFSLLGYQEYYTDSKQVKEIDDLYFESCRLGIIREEFHNVEPLMRDSHLVSMDASAIKHSEMQAHFNPSPNGFYGEEICRISRLAGLSDSLKCFALFETNPRFDLNNQAANLMAQIIWYFIEGRSLRNIEIPSETDNNYKKFVVKTEQVGHDIEFVKSIVTNRWWLKIPLINSKSHEYIACTVDDYNQACNDEIPEKWLKAYQRLN